MNIRQDDCHLLERYRETGDEKAFLLLYSRHFRPLRMKVAKILGGDHAAAEDIVQQTFANLAHENQPHFVPRDLRSWLNQCVTNAAFNQRRSAKRRSSREEEYAKLSLTASSAPAASDRFDAVRHQIATLDPLDAKAIFARHVEGLSYEEVARRYGFTSPDAGRKRIRRAIDHLRQRAPALGILATMHSVVRGALVLLTNGISGAARSYLPRVALIVGSVGFSVGLCMWWGKESNFEESTQHEPITREVSLISTHSEERQATLPPSAARNPHSSPRLIGATDSSAEQEGILAYWKFDQLRDNLSFDEIARNPARAAGRSILAPGRDGHAAVRVIHGAGLEVANARFLNESSRSRAVSIAFWQKNEGTLRSSAFFGVSIDSSDRRGIQAHVPWEDGRIYWDSSGKERLIADPTSVFPDWNWADGSWHHYTFVKDGDIHRLWLDGILLAECLAGDLPEDFTSLWIGSNDGASPVSNPGAIDDFVVFSSALRRDQVRLLASGKSPWGILSHQDQDSDGLPDSYETDHGLDPSLHDSAGDADADGLTHLQEFHRGTDPKLADSDADGLPDAVETGTGVWVSNQNTGTQSLIADTDQDGLLDGVETHSGYFITISNTGTHPLASDTDKDGFPDRVEIISQSDPLDSSSSPISGALPVLAAYWDFDSPTEPWRDHVSGLTAQPGASNRLVRGPKGGALRIGSKLGLRVPKASFQRAAGSLDTIVITFWLKGAEHSKGCAVFAESPSSEGMIGLRIHAPWKNGGIIFDTPRLPQYRGSARGFVNARSLSPAWEWEKKRWHHFVFSKHGRKKEIWLDGTLVFSGEAGPLPEDLADLWIGSDPAGNSIPGMLDEFAVFVTPLGENHITQLAQGMRPDELDFPSLTFSR